MRDRPRALTVLISVFLVGCVLGAAGSFFWSRRTLQVFREALPGNPAFQRGHGHQKLSDLLQLTPEQEARFRQIMAESRKNLEALQEEQKPRLEAIRSETNRKITAILNEEQRERFTAFLEETRKYGTRLPRGPDMPERQR